MERKGVRWRGKESTSERRRRETNELNFLPLFRLISQQVSIAGTRTLSTIFSYTYHTERVQTRTSFSETQLTQIQVKSFATQTSQLWYSSLQPLEQLSAWQHPI